MNENDLPKVGEDRLWLLRQDERAWNEDLNRDADVCPDEALLLVFRVEGVTHE